MSFNDKEFFKYVLYRELNLKKKKKKSDFAVKLRGSLLTKKTVTLHQTNRGADRWLGSAALDAEVLWEEKDQSHSVSVLLSLF